MAASIKLDEVSLTQGQPDPNYGYIVNPVPSLPPRASSTAIVRPQEHPMRAVPMQAGSTSVPAAFTAGPKSGFIANPDKSRAPRASSTVFPEPTEWWQMMFLVMPFPYRWGENGGGLFLKKMRRETLPRAKTSVAS
jgi:hypothetical protein